MKKNRDGAEMRSTRRQVPEIQAPLGLSNGHAKESIEKVESQANKYSVC